MTPWICCLGVFAREFIGLQNSLITATFTLRQVLILCFRPENMPWLYYLGEGDDILTDDGIATEFTFPDSTLDFVLAKYSLNGTFIEFMPVTGGALQLCENTRSILDAAYLFGTTYKQEVRMYYLNVRMSSSMLSSTG